MTDFIAIPAITVLCYLGAEIFKALTQESIYKHIPVLCGAVGLILGVICYLLIPGYIPAENVLVAAAIGAVSGWAASGVYDTYSSAAKGSGWNNVES